MQLDLINFHVQDVMCLCYIDHLIFNLLNLTGFLFIFSVYFRDCQDCKVLVACQQFR